LGTGLPDSRISMDGQSLREISWPSPTCDNIVEYMLTVHGLNVDVVTEEIMQAMNLVMVGGNGFGPYPGRVNKNEARKGTPYRLVPGAKNKSYRLIELL